MALSQRIVHARSTALRTLKAAEGMPMSDRTLREMIKQQCQGEWTELDLGEVIRDLDLSGYIAGTVREFDGQRIWTLTDKGQITAAQLH